MKHFISASLLAVAIILGGASPSKAVLMVSIERVSDTVGVITGTGSSDVSTAGLFFAGPVTTLGDPGPDPFAGDLTLGGFSVVAAFTVASDTDFILGFSDPYPIGAIFAGSLTVTLDAETWLPVGTTGGLVSLGTPNGTWEIVASTAVPAPSVLSIFVVGLVALGVAGRRGRRQAI